MMFVEQKKFGVECEYIRLSTYTQIDSKSQFFELSPLPFNADNHCVLFRGMITL